MKTFYGYALVAALAVAGMNLNLHAEIKAKDVADQKASGDKLEQIAANLADESTTQDVHTLLAKAVNDAATEGRFDDLIANLAKVDRDRIGDFKHQKTEDLNKIITQFRSDFKTKYNQDFAIRADHFNDAIVYAGRDKNSATALLPDLLFNRKADVLKTPALKPDAKPIPDTIRLGTGLTLNLVNEGKLKSAWRINIPSEINADQLKANLTKRIQMLDDQKAVWPTDPADGYRTAAFQILSALNDAGLAIDQ